MDRKYVHRSMSSMLHQAAHDCLRIGHQFVLFNGELYHVAPKAALLELDQFGQMKVLNQKVLTRTGIFENDLFGSEWAERKETHNG